jgi:hypothetical protein
MEASRPHHPDHRPRAAAAARLLAVAATAAMIAAAWWLASGGSRTQHVVVAEPGARYDLRIMQVGAGSAAPGVLVVRGSAVGTRPLHAAPTTAAARRAHAYLLFRVDGGRYDHAQFVDPDALDAWFLREDFTTAIITRSGADTPPVVAGEVSTAPAWKLRYHGIPAGRHQVEAWLVRADHRPLAHAEPIDVQVA